MRHSWSLTCTLWHLKSCPPLAILPCLRFACSRSSSGSRRRRSVPGATGGCGAAAQSGARPPRQHLVWRVSGQLAWVAGRWGRAFALVYLYLHPSASVHARKTAAACLMVLLAHPLLIILLLQPAGGACGAGQRHHKGGAGRHDRPPGAGGWPLTQGWAGQGWAGLGSHSTLVLR